jgi:hypothetical protein
MNKRCCSNCANAVRPIGRWFRVILSRWPGLLTCLSHPDAPGRLMGVACCASCANFRPRHKPAVRSAPLEPPDDNVRYIPLTQGKYAIVDAGDYERVSRYKWCLSRTGKQLYAQRRTGGKTIRMHQFIMNPPKGMVVDHIDGNGLNNRRSNLRICTRPENTRNRRVNPNTSTGFKGVWRDKKTGKCWAQIYFEGKPIRLGSFATAVEAARAYDRKAIELFGQFARLNFPEEHPAQTSPGQ